MQSTYIEFTSKNVVEVKTEEIATDNLSPMEVVITNEASVISAGTELARLQGREDGMGFPARPGYGAVGRITAAGEGVTDLKVGDRVFYAGDHASVQRFTHGEDHQWGYLFPVPDGVDSVDATMGCMAEIAMTAPNVTELALNDTVAVFGLGLVGILAAQLYALRGARVIGVDPVPHRCELARQVGIETVVDVPPDKQVEAVRAATGGEGALVTCDATGLTPAVQNCINSTALYGQVVLLGTPRAAYEGNVTQPLNAVHMNGLVVRGAHMWRYPVRTTRTTPRSVEWAFGTTFDLIRTGKLKVHELISHVITPDQAPETYDGLTNRRDEYVGAVIRW